jgi:hypothetical protein
METNPKYRGRISAAWWSKTILAGAAVISVLILPFSLDLETVVVVAGVLTVTFLEFRVHRYFLTGDPRGPDLGFRNQSGFAAGILLYGLYHAFHVTPLESLIPPEMIGYIDQPTLDFMKSMIKNAYLAVGILGGASQFGLAWYYRGAKTPSAAQG